MKKMVLICVGMMLSLFCSGCMSSKERKDLETLRVEQNTEQVERIEGVSAVWICGDDEEVFLVKLPNGTGSLIRRAKADVVFYYDVPPELPMWAEYKYTMAYRSRGAITIHLHSSGDIH